MMLHGVCLQTELWVAHGADLGDPHAQWGINELMYRTVSTNMATAAEDSLYGLLLKTDCGSIHQICDWMMFKRMLNFANPSLSNLLSAVQNCDLCVTWEWRLSPNKCNLAVQTVVVLQKIWYILDSIQHLKVAWIWF